MKYQANPQASQNVLYTTEVWSDAPVEQDLARLTVDHFVSLYYLPYIQPRKRSWEWMSASAGNIFLWHLERVPLPASRAEK